MRYQNWERRDAGRHQGRTMLLKWNVSWHAAEADCRPHLGVKAKAPVQRVRQVRRLLISIIPVQPYARDTVVASQLPHPAYQRSKEDVVFTFKRLQLVSESPSSRPSGRLVHILGCVSERASPPLQGAHDLKAVTMTATISRETP